jgi:hypothetical protein
VRAHRTVAQLADSIGNLAADVALAKERGTATSPKSDSPVDDRLKATEGKAKEEETAPTVPKATAEELLAEVDLPHLMAHLTDWGGCVDAVKAGRQQTLAFLKGAGVAKLPERQKLATALAKAHRDERL